MLSLVEGLPRQVAVPIVICFFFILYRFYIAFSGPLRHIPGPGFARFTRYWEIRKTWRGDFELLNVALHKQYGPTVRIAPNRYSISDPLAIPIIYGAGSKFSKSEYYWPFGPPMVDHKDLFSEMDNAKHSAGRKKLSHMYSMSALVSYEPYVDKVNAEFMSRMDGFTEQGMPFDLFDWMQYYAFDVIGEITIGRSFGLIQAGRDKDGLLKAVDTGNTKYGAIVGLIPEVHIWYLRFARLLALNDHNSVIQQVIQKEIAARMGCEKLPDREDFLAKCINLLQSGKIDQMDMINVIGMNIGAGSDTTGISLSTVIFNLIRNPQCMEKLRHELDTAVENKQISNPITFRESQCLIYLQAVIKEALRMHAAVGTILARVVPKGGTVITGTHFPEGTVVGMNAWVVHNDENIWGPDVSTFNPERWLGAREQVTRMERHFLGFGAGARTCLGKNISLLEMSKLLPTLLQRYDFSVVPGSEWTTHSGWFVKPKIEVMIVRRRQHNR